MISAATESPGLAMALLEAASDATIVAHDDGRIAMVNTQAERLFGYDRAQLIGEDVGRLLPERFRRAHRARFPRVGRPLRRNSLYVRRSDGSDLPVEIALTPVATEHEVLVCATLRDLSDRRHAEAELRRQHARIRSLTAANQELEAFAHTVSHELRAPIRAVHGFTRLVLEDAGDDLDEPAREALRRACRAAGALSELVDALLELSWQVRRVERRDLVDLSALAEGVVRELRADDPDRAVRVEIEPAMRALGDERLLRIALHNLIGNAWKFTAGHSHARIDLGTCPDGFFVRDNGAGFDMARAGRLFAPFQRLHRGDEFPGTGLGLATVQRIVHRHGGHIRAEAARDEGATFIFSLGEPA